MSVDALFWEAEAQRLMGVMEPWMTEAAERGVAEGLELLGTDLAAGGIDFELVNQQARAWAVVNTAQVVASITRTSMEAFVTAFPEWVASGEPLRDLIDTLKDSYEPWRARLIAATETTRAYARGNMVMWGASGFVEEIKWQTSVDELVCPICGKLMDTQAPLGGSFEGGYESPPAHPGCRCWILPALPENRANTTEDFRDFSVEEMQSRYQPLVDSLTDLEIKAIRDYADIDYRKINQALRDRDLSELPKDVRLTYDNLMSVASRAEELPETLQLHRYVDRDKLKKLFLDGDIVAGDTFEDLGFLSTSIDPDFSDREGSLNFRIKVGKGHRGIFMGYESLSTYWDVEQEVLLAPGSRLIIDRVTNKGGYGSFKTVLVEGHLE